MKAEVEVNINLTPRNLVDGFIAMDDWDRSEFFNMLGYEIRVDRYYDDDSYCKRVLNGIVESGNLDDDGRLLMLKLGEYSGR